MTLYYRYSGEYRDVGIYIDEVASFLWENVSTAKLLLV